MADNKYRVASEWLVGEKDKEQFKNRLLNNRDLFRKLEKMANALKLKHEQTTRDITNPNWINAVAYAEGYKAAIDDLIKYLPKDPK